MPFFVCIAQGHIGNLGIALFAVLAEGTAKFADDDHRRITPGVAHLLFVGVEAASQFFKLGGEDAFCAALIDVRIPAADIDET